MSGLRSYSGSLGLLPTMHRYKTWWRQRCLLSCSWRDSLSSWTCCVFQQLVSASGSSYHNHLAARTDFPWQMSITARIQKAHPSWRKSLRTWYDNTRESQGKGQMPWMANINEFKFSLLCINLFPTESDSRILWTWAEMNTEWYRVVVTD